MNGPGAGTAGRAASGSRGHAKLPVRGESAPNWRSVCEMHDPTGEPDAGDPHVRFGGQGVETGPEHHRRTYAPDPTGTAPPLTLQGGVFGSGMKE